MTRTLITGVDGFTGRYLADRLMADGHEVHGTVHGVVTGGDNRVVRHACDLADADALSALMAEVRPDHVVHLAAIAFVAHGDIAEMYRTNIVGSRNLLEAVARHAPGVQSLLLASSANIYGNSREGVLDETTPPDPANDYAVTKLAMEHVASLYRDRLPIIIARPFNYTGVGQGDNFLIPKIVSHVRRRAPVIELGNLDVARDFSDVRMITDGYARLLTAPHGVGQTFNFCSGRAISLAQVLEMAQRIAGHEMDVRVNPQFVRANDVKTLSGSPAKVEAAIGPLNIEPFDRTLEWMIGAGPSCA